MNKANIKELSKKMEEYDELLQKLKNDFEFKNHNNPTGEYAEKLCMAYLELNYPLKEDAKGERNNTKGYDLVDALGKTYQVKGRRFHEKNTVQFDTFYKEGNDDLGFDYLVTIIFGEKFTVKAVYKISSEELVSKKLLKNKKRKGKELSALYVSYDDKFREVADDITDKFTGYK
ncbi:MAG: hypothetical protein IJ849_11800 [Selenomonadaceae bacterium]|nr:hypothetical protein [Selenomonadaceae bacterium]